MGLLEHVRSPDDLRDLTDAQLETLASEIRDVLVAPAPRAAVTSVPTSASSS